MSKKKARIVCPIFETSKYPYHGLGVKVGDPSAVTYKFYASKHFAVVVDFGSAASGLYYKYHKDNLIRYAKTDTLSGDQSVDYIGHTVTKEWVGEIKLLYQHDASGLVEGLQWYIGAGWQARKLDISYEYLREAGLNESLIEKFNVSAFTMGPTATIGLEYAYYDLPISTFMEIELYSDAMEDAGWMRFQGGAGIRYIFN
ncbi:MAG: hypothetical protein WD555_05345 [Fulvivirga sp.]